MTIENQNLDFYAGDTCEITILVTDENNNPKDISNLHVYWALYNNNTNENLVTKIVGSGISLVIPTSGILSVTLNPEDTISLKPGNFYGHQAEIVDLIGIVSTICTGNVKINRDHI